jgi:hypothetical protein
LAITYVNDGETPRIASRRPARPVLNNLFTNTFNAYLTGESAPATGAGLVLRSVAASNRHVPCEGAWPP